MIKEMAAQTVMLHQDRCAKNYYVFKSRSSGKWVRIPWDMEDAFATDYRNSAGALILGEGEEGSVYFFFSFMT